MNVKFNCINKYEYLESKKGRKTKKKKREKTMDEWEKEFESKYEMKEIDCPFFVSDDLWTKQDGVPQTDQEQREALRYVEEVLVPRAHPIISNMSKNTKQHDSIVLSICKKMSDNIEKYDDNIVEEDNDDESDNGDCYANPLMYSLFVPTTKNYNELCGDEASFLQHSQHTETCWCNETKCSMLYIFF